MQATITTTDGIEDWPSVIQRLYAYWDAKRAGRPMPRRAEIDPADFAELLPHILLVDVHHDPERFVYRVVGTGEVEVRGQDPTGLDVAQGFYGPSAEDALESYRFVRDSRSFLLDPRPFLGPGGKFNQNHVLFLPLSEDGRNVSQILIYALVHRLSW